MNSGQSALSGRRLWVWPSIARGRLDEYDEYIAGWRRPRHQARNNGSADQPLQIWALRDVGSAARKLATRGGPNRALREPRPKRATCTGADAPEASSSTTKRLLARDQPKQHQRT